MATDTACRTWSVQEAAAIIGISTDSLYRAIKAPRSREFIPWFRLGRSLRIPRAWVDDLVEGRLELPDMACI